ncbi:MAG: YihY/virulence factor BrkB family protein [Sphaerochaetaceae bacterium]|jgi:membrane protein
MSRFLDLFRKKPKQEVQEQVQEQPKPVELSAAEKLYDARLHFKKLLETEEPAAQKRSFRILLKSLGYLFSIDSVTVLAGGMVYSSLMAIVPVVTILIYILGALGVVTSFLDGFTSSLIEIFGEQTGSQIGELVSTWSTNAGSLGLIGLISFVITFVFLINRLWVVYNKLYRTKMITSQARQFTNYLTYFFTGVILLAAFISIKSFFSDFLAELSGRAAFGFGVKAFRFIIPKLLLWTVLVVLINSVPNGQVQPRAALIGGTFSFVGIVLVNTLFKWIIKSLVSYSIIYGSLSSLLFLLLWLYLIWILVFAGVELSYAYQFYPVQETTEEIVSPSKIVTQMLNLLLAVFANFDQKKGPIRRQGLEKTQNLPSAVMERQIQSLIEAKLLIEVRDANGYASLMPGYQIKDMLLSDVLKIIMDINSLDTMMLSTEGGVIAHRICQLISDEFQTTTMQEVLETTVRMENAASETSGNLDINIFGSEEP